MVKRVSFLLLFIIIVISIFSCIEELQKQPLPAVPLINHSADLTGFDFNKDVVQVVGNQEYHPNRLYTPEDFAKGGLNPSDENDPNQRVAVEYGTKRFTVKLPAGMTYAISGLSTQYSMALYINGELAVEAGHPADTKEETIPKTIQYTAFFTPETDTSEFVVQYANFHHNSGGGGYPVTIGKAETIAQMNEKATLSTFIRAGCMLTVFLFYLGMFTLYRRKSYFLTFALCCLLVGMAAFWSGGRTVALFFPSLSWFVSIAVEYLISIFTLVLFTAYLSGMQPGLLNQWALRAYYAYSGIYALLVLLCEPRFYTGLLLYFQIGVGLFFLHIFWRLLRNLRRRNMEEALLFAGVTVYLATSIMEAFFNSFSSRIYIAFFANISQSGMMAFVFINMMALALQFSRTESNLLKSRLRETELEQTNRLLERLNQIRTEFLGNISHEMKTPLTIMSTSAQMSKKKLERGFDDEEVYRNLELISSEAKRLSEMVSEHLNLSHLRESKAVMEPVHIGEIIRETAVSYERMLQKNNNLFVLNIIDGLPPVFGNADLLAQVLVNAITNANDHTENGTVTINAAPDGDQVTVRITDTGTGIADEHLPHVFERFYTGKKGGAGLGLPICKEIIEFHGGRIELAKAEPKGAALLFTLPVFKGDKTA